MLKVSHTRLIVFILTSNDWVPLVRSCCLIAQRRWRTTSAPMATLRIWPRLYERHAADRGFGAEREPVYTGSAGDSSARAFDPDDAAPGSRGSGLCTISAQAFDLPERSPPRLQGVASNHPSDRLARPTARRLLAQSVR